MDLAAGAVDASTAHDDPQGALRETLEFEHAIRRRVDLSRHQDQGVHGAVLISILLQIAVVMTPIGNNIFHTVPMSAAAWGLAVLLSVAGALVVLIVSTFMPGMNQRGSGDGA